MDYRQMTSPCGLDCFNCRMYLANDDTELRTANAEALGLPYEEAKCEGCRNAGGTIAFLGDTEPCDVFRCAAEKGVAFCYQCSDFPCDYLHPYADQASVRQHNTKLFNLCLIKKMGLEQWARTKAKSVKETYFNGKLRVHSREKAAKDESSTA
ncbi:MAG TPA: DUF3795 domain-containing protein [Desulfomonilaceae bacterium]|nr:DUF3795 domain-containing protein [Desulfomonilaceae bacterium]